MAVLVFYSAFLLEREERSEASSFSASPGTAPTLLASLFVLRFSSLPLTLHQRREKKLSQKFCESFGLFHPVWCCLKHSTSHCKPPSVLLSASSTCTSWEFSTHLTQLVSPRTVINNAFSISTYPHAELCYPCSRNVLTMGSPEVYLITFNYLWLFTCI